MIAKKTSKNQLTLPKDIVKEFPGIDYFEVRVKGRTIVLTPAKISTLEESLPSVQDKMKRLGIGPSDVDDAVAWARRIK